MDQMIKMKAEDVKEVFEKGFLEPLPRPHFGGLITDPMPGRVRKLEERTKVLEGFVLKLVQNMKPLDPEFSKTVDEHFWEMI